RNFCNKLWNVARYIEGELGEKLQSGSKPEPKTAADHWILERLDKATQTVSDHLNNYRFSEAYELLYHVIWDELADWYIEASKGQQNASVLNYALETSLKLVHPFAPFVTETIWQTLHPDTDDLLITSSWPKAASYNAKQSRDFEKIKQIV